MTVVTNTSPLLNLAVIGEARLLPELFGRVTAPTVVREEIHSLRSRDRRFRTVDIANAADFATVQDRSRVTLLTLHLDPGEAEAIALALELQADLILLDERRASRAARHLGLKSLGLLGVLLLAKRKGLIHEVRPLLDRLQTEAGFWIGPALRLQVLRAAEEG